MATIPAPPTAPGNRFARFTTDNHSAPVWIASILSLIYAFCVLAVRLGFVKWNAHGLDDVVLTLAHLVGLGMWGALFSSLNNGLGKSLELLSVAEISDMQKSYYASSIMLCIALALSKCSALIFIQAIFSQTSKVILVGNATTCLVALWGLGSSLAVSLSCSANHIIPNSGTDHCVRLVPWLKVVAAGDILTEVVIILLPVIGLRNLHMPMKRRLLVVMAFSFRVPNIFISIMHLITYSDFHGHHRQATDIVPAVVWQNALLSYNFMSATIPALKGFVKGFTTGGVGYTTDMSTSGGRSGNNDNYELRSLPKSKTHVKLLPKGYAESKVRVSSVQPNPNAASSRVDRITRDKSRSCQDEIESIASHDSRRIMIERGWEISRG